MSYILAAQGCVGSRHAHAQAPFGRNNVPRSHCNVAKFANWPAERESPCQSHYVEHRSCTMRASAAAPKSGSMDEASFFIRNLRALPWQRAAVWLVVILAASQLSDFFGVRFHSLTGVSAAAARGGNALLSMCACSHVWP